MKTFSSRFCINLYYPRQVFWKCSSFTGIFLNTILDKSAEQFRLELNLSCQIWIDISFSIALVPIKFFWFVCFLAAIAWWWFIFSNKMFSCLLLLSLYSVCLQLDFSKPLHFFINNLKLRLSTVLEVWCSNILNSETLRDTV